MKNCKINKKLIIGIIGGNICSQKEKDIAYNIGSRVAELGYKIVCGGKKGTMEAACKGAKSAGGLTIGILPGDSKREANKYIDIPIVTAMSNARNSIIVRTADILIAIGGKYGTLSELALAKLFNKPVYAFKSWNIKGIKKVKSVNDFIKRIK